MKRIIVTVFLVLFACGSAPADLLDLSNAPEREKYVLTFSYKGIDMKNPPKTPLSKRYIIAGASLEAVVETKFVGEGPGRHLESVVISKTFSGCRQKLFFRFKPGNKLILDYYESTSFAPSGKKVTTESYHVSELVPPVPENIVHPSTLPLAIRGIDFTPGKKYSLSLWFNPITIFVVDLVVKGEEKVTVPAGTFTCHRVDIIPDMVDILGPVVGRMFKSLAPKVSVWVDKEPPHRLVKYRGPFGMFSLDSSQTEFFELKEIIE